MGWVWSLQKLACRLSEGHPRPQLSSAPVCGSSRLSLIERAAMPPLQQMQATRCPCPSPGSALCPCQMASGCYRVLNLGVFPGWLPDKVQQCPSVPRARASSLLPRRQVGVCPLLPPWVWVFPLPSHAGSLLCSLPHAGVSRSERAPVGLFAIFETKQW